MFNWWTFFFQIVNFIVVVYILYRVLFRPVREMILRRREEIDKSRREIESEKAETGVLKKEYELKLHELETLKKTTLETARTEALKERERILTDTKAEIEREREKLRKLIEDERKRLYEDAKKKAIDLSAELSTRILSSIVDGTINKALIKKTLDKIKNISEDEKKEVLSGSEHCTVQIDLASEIDDVTKEEIIKTIEDTMDCKIETEHSINPDLIGGIIIRIGSRVFDGTLKGNIERAVESLKGA